MTNFLGGESVAGGEMKTTHGWSNGGNGTNSSGFSGLPGGGRILTDFALAGYHGVWWSSSFFSPYARNRYIEGSNEVVQTGSSSPLLGLSVRCVREAE